MKFLLEQYDINPDVFDDTDIISTPGIALRTACILGFDEIARILLGHPKCDMTLTGFLEFNCLNCAAQKGSVSMINLILDFANLNQVKLKIINHKALHYSPELIYLVRGKDQGKLLGITLMLGDH